MHDGMGAPAGVYWGVQAGSASPTPMAVTLANPWAARYALTAPARRCYKPTLYDAPPVASVCPMTSVMLRPAALSSPVRRAR